ncbi:Lrp/AsnC ligand binding domain-containing protein [candidate division WOR-3 bacterium]|nr:Lrp/AsnC ligand binding domain-containing protein [candidate division WOR-3 bacterium]
MSAFILIKVRPSSAEKVLKATRKFKQVSQVYLVTGIYDIIAVVDVADLKDLGEIVAEKIHRIDGVSSTITCIKVK